MLLRLVPDDVTVFNVGDFQVVGDVFRDIRQYLRNAVKVKDAL